MSGDRLAALVRAARWRRAAAWSPCVLAAALCAGAFAARLGASPGPAALVAGALAAVAIAMVLRRHPIDAALLAAHLDRTVGTLEESGALLLEADRTDTPLLVRLQRRRAEAAFAAVERVPPLPQRRARRGLPITATLLALAAFATWWPRPGRAAPTGDAPSRPAPRATLGAVRLEWTPPRYTGRPAAAAAGDATVEEGSPVVWRITAPHARSVRLVTARGDTLAASPDGAAQWRVALAPAQAMYWRVEAIGDDGTVLRGDDRVLALRADREPTVAILAPLGRVELDWSEPHEVVVRAAVGDDYGLQRLRLAVTTAKGRGEGVKFSERFLPLETERADGPTRVVSRRVSLDSLGAEPGDEFFLAVEVTDNRAPVPHVVRSETIFLSLHDTAGVTTSDLAGIALRIEPAYFRSQRQIILDTEALLADLRRGPLPDRGRARSMAIGADQHLLRVRYGALVGEENEGEDGDGADDHDADSASALNVGRHDHDMEENATLLSAEVKATLKRALASMWEAEKLLRTGDPKGALPHEYRALLALEEVRRADRVYVQRVAFTPPPIDAARLRLSREAKPLGPLTRTVAAPGDTPDAPLHRALAHLNGGTFDRDAFDAAGRRLAERILGDEPGAHRDALRALRGLLDGGCADCAARAARGLLAALPSPVAPVRPRRGATGAFGTRP